MIKGMANCDTSDIKPIYHKFLCLDLILLHKTWCLISQTVFTLCESQQETRYRSFLNKLQFDHIAPLIIEIWPISYYNWNAMGHTKTLLTLWWLSECAKIRSFCSHPHTSTSSLCTTFLIVWECQWRLVCLFLI